MTRYHFIWKSVFSKRLSPIVSGFCRGLKDLNPTENVCQTANQSRTGDREYVTTQVYSAYNPAMTGIMWKYVRNLSNRVEAVIAARAGKTMYWKTLFLVNT